MPNFVIADTAIAKQQGFTVTREGVILVTQKVIDHQRLVSGYR